jgi:hypothetical protein
MSLRVRLTALEEASEWVAVEVFQATQVEW